MRANHSFREVVREDLRTLLSEQQRHLNLGDCLKIDLHCHDHNSSVPDELLGRILGVPETWLPTDQLLKTLHSNGSDVVTVTNHNNAKSCWELLEKGFDILAGAEFSCTIPDLDLGVHVLTYGFTPAHEPELLKLKQNLYRFLDFACEHDLPTVLAHPLHFHDPKRRLTPAEFDRLGVLFERFEVVNGQRDSWQNVMTAAWLKNLTAERLDSIGKRTGINPGRYCRNPYRKVMCGGSDDHMGIFAGLTGSLVEIPGLGMRLRNESKPALALEALRKGAAAPYGSYNEDEKLVLAVLDYFCQVAMHMRDPGLVRMLLHRGSAQDKVLALAISNAIFEIRRHRYTLKFLTAFHESLAGTRPGRISSLMSSRAWKPLIQHLDELASLRRMSSSAILEGMQPILSKIFRDLNLLLASRVQRNVKNMDALEDRARPGSQELVRRFELPSHIRAFFGETSGLQDPEMTRVDVGALFDGLSFPALASAVIAGSNFAATHALHKDRAFLNQFAKGLGHFQHPRKALWLTDTIDDKNGVSRALRSILAEVQQGDLPVDFLVCSNSAVKEDHLVTLRPIMEFAVPAYRSQVFRVPDLMELQEVFRRGSYDRIVCSTELIMGPIALFLKQAFLVPAFFYVHTDWLDFADKTLQLETKSRDRIRRLLRAFYRSFDGLLVLNSEQSAWLAGPSMGIARDKIFLTAHWADSHFRAIQCDKARVFPGVDESSEVLLFAGRLSEEKGVLEIPEMYQRVKEGFPNVKIAIAGEGPAESRLRGMMPDAIYLGWVDSHRLPELYSAANLLILPSQFDTFGCVVLEAMSCGLPVIAYDTKGPRDLIQDRVNGFLVRERSEFPERILEYLSDEALRTRMSQAAAARSLTYRPHEILSRLMEDLGLIDESAARSEEERPSVSELDPGIANTYRDGGPSFLEDLLEFVRVE